MTFLIVVGVILALSLSFLTYASKSSVWLKILILSCLLSLGWGGHTVYTSRLGTPIKGYPPDSFVYVWHTLTNSDTIIIWVNTDELGFRLYEIPYDRETAKTLERARESEQGVEGVFSEQGNGNSPSLEIGDIPNDETEGMK